MRTKEGRPSREEESAQQSARTTQDTTIHRAFAHRPVANVTPRQGGGPMSDWLPNYDAWLTEEPEHRDPFDEAQAREDAILDRAGL